MTDGIKLKGTGRAILLHEDGTKEIYEKHNLIVTAGYDFIVKSLISSTGRPAVLGYVAVGTGTGAAASSQTALVNEVGRATGTWTWTAGEKKFTISASFAKGAITGAISEGGVFNASTDGTMFDRCVFTNPITVDATIAYTQEFDFEIM